MKRILFAGDYWPGSNTVYIARAFEQHSAIVRWSDDTQIFPAWSTKPGRIVRRFAHKLIEREWNQQLLSSVESFRPNLVYLSNAHLCWPETIESIQARSIPVMCFYHDPSWRNRERSRFKENISLFDLVSSTRPWHANDFQESGARKVLIVRFGYDPGVHRPVQLSSKTFDYYHSEASFVGTIRPNSLRVKHLSWLLGQASPSDISIWGAGDWKQVSRQSVLYKAWRGRDLQETELPLLYAASNVALHWVNWEPESDDIALRLGDQHNSRTFQIPACGGAIMFAQRTEQHLQFFKEDSEAVYFGDEQELQDKLSFWLRPANETARRRMAEKARVRCITEDYSYVPVVQEYLDFFDLS